MSARPIPGTLAVLYARSVMLGTSMRPVDDLFAPPEEPALGRTFVYWLSVACKAARLEGELKQTDIPEVQSKLSRFETHGKWPDDPERVVQAYAQALGLRDSRFLWNLAIDLWLMHGQPPMPIEPRQVPAIPEGQLLQRLREGLPSAQDLPRRTSSQADQRRGNG